MLLFINQLTLHYAPFKHTLTSPPWPDSLTVSFIVSMAHYKGSPIELACVSYTCVFWWEEHQFAGKAREETRKDPRLINGPEKNWPHCVEVYLRYLMPYNYLCWEYGTVILAITPRPPQLRSYVSRSSTALGPAHAQEGIVAGFLPGLRCLTLGPGLKNLVTSAA